MEDVDNIVEISPKRKYIWRFNLIPTLFVAVQIALNVAIYAGKEIGDIFGSYLRLFYVFNIFISFIAYFNVAFSNPGYFKVIDQQFQKDIEIIETIMDKGDIGNLPTTAEIKVEEKKHQEHRRKVSVLTKNIRSNHRKNTHSNLSSFRQTTANNETKFSKFTDESDPYTQNTRSNVRHIEYRDGKRKKIIAESSVNDHDFKKSTFNISKFKNNTPRQQNMLKISKEELKIKDLGEIKNNLDVGMWNLESVNSYTPSDADFCKITNISELKTDREHTEALGKFKAILTKQILSQKSHRLTFPWIVHIEVYVNYPKWSEQFIVLPERNELHATTTIA